jgi:hypothetical protein
VSLDSFLLDWLIKDGNLSFKELMQVKNTLIYLSGFITGIILISILCSLAMLKNKSRRTYDKLDDVVLVKVKDRNSNEHLIISVKTFTQAFYSMYTGLWFMLSSKNKYTLIRDSKKEKLFFVSVMTVYAIIIFLTVWGILDIIRYQELLEKYPNLKAE